MNDRNCIRREHIQAVNEVQDVHRNLDLYYLQHETLLEHLALGQVFVVSISHHHLYEVDRVQAEVGYYGYVDYHALTLPEPIG